MCLGESFANGNCRGHLGKCMIKVFLLLLLSSLLRFPPLKKKLFVAKKERKKASFCGLSLSRWKSHRKSVGVLTRRPFQPPPPPLFPNARGGEGERRKWQQERKNRKGPTDPGGEGFFRSQSFRSSLRFVLFIDFSQPRITLILIY